MIRIGAVNLDTSHPLAFARYLRPGGRARYAAVYNDGFRGDDEVDAFIGAFGVDRRYDTIEEMADNVDVGFIHGNDWHTHLPQAKGVHRARQAGLSGQAVRGQ